MHRSHYPCTGGHPLPVARGAAWRHALPGAALAVLLGLFSGCASAPSSVDDGMAAGEVDYAARHERMLQVVLEQPARTRALLEAREREARLRARESWDDVMARQEAFMQTRQRKRKVATEDFLRLIERHRIDTEERERERTERWALFIESNGIGAAVQGGNGTAGPPSAQGTAP